MDKFRRHLIPFVQILDISREAIDKKCISLSLMFGHRMLQ